MIKNAHRKILYSLIGLLVVSGVALFFARPQLLDYLRQRSNLEELTVSGAVATGASETLDTDILKTAKFKALKNNILKFDFDNLCSRSGASEVKELSVEVATTTTTTPAVNCSLGNNNLFFIKQK